MNNQDIIFQSPDLHQDNPLDTTSAIPSKKFNLPQDKRILVLVILGVLIILLFIVSLIAVSIRNNTPKTTIIPTPTTFPTQISTPTPQALPTEFQDISNKINQSLNVTPEILPPKIDDTIGL